MAKLLLQNTIKRVDGTNLTNVPVVARLCPSNAFSTAAANEFVRELRTATNASGFWSLNLEKNTDITPTGTWYEIYEAVPKVDGGPRTWICSVIGTTNPLNLFDALLADLPADAATYPLYPPQGGEEGDSLRWLSSKTVWRDRVFFPKGAYPNPAAIGDFVVDDATEALYTWNGSNWVLISGPPNWWSGTQAEFNSLGTYDPNMLYVIKAG